MTLSQKHKFIFVCNPKTGSTAVENYLKIWEPDALHNVIPDAITGEIKYRLNGHTPTKVLKDCMGEAFNNYKVFTFIRNPYEKVVSAYFFYRKGFGEPIKFKNKRIFILKLNVYLATFLPFKIWSLIKTVKSNEGYITDNNGNIIVNFIGRTENLNNDLLAIVTELGMDVNLDTKIKKINKSTHKDSYLDYFKVSWHKFLFDSKYKREFEVYNKLTSHDANFDWRGKNLMDLIIK